VAAHGTPTLFVNLNGNPGMATGGMGDALTGLIGGLLAQGLAPFAAACAGVYVHGLAGDCAAAHHSQAGLTAGDVIEEITNVLRDIQGR
ncbi:MAG: ADP-dependent NAD(P)H-hydrate dehydratase, partial [Kiritimatiellia bacterium]